VRLVGTVADLALEEVVDGFFFFFFFSLDEGEPDAEAVSLGSFPFVCAGPSTCR
jgi:hypothetical protein